MSRWQLIWLVVKVLCRLLFKRDISSVLDIFAPKVEPETPTAPKTASNMVYDVVKSRLVHGGRILPLLLLMAGLAYAGGSFTAYDGLTKLNKRITGGVGIDILTSGELRATGVAVPISIQPWSNISTASRGNLLRPTSSGDQLSGLINRVGYSSALYDKNPVLADATYHRRDPSRIIRVGDTYYWYYNRMAADAVDSYDVHDSVIAYATSPSMLGPWTEQGVLLQKGVSGWDSYGVYCPDIVVDGGNYYLFYTGSTGSVSTTTDGIGVAVSSSPSGPFTKYASNPVLTVSATSTDWDAKRANAPYLLKLDDGTWRMYYKGRGPATGTAYRYAGIATATAGDFPYTWSRYSSNPIFGNAVNGSPTGDIDDINVIKLGDYYYALATRIGIAANGQQNVWYRSANGINGWTATQEIPSALATDQVGSPIGYDVTGAHVALIDGELAYLAYNAAATPGGKDGLGLVVFNRTVGTRPTTSDVQRNIPFDLTQKGTTIAVTQNGVTKAIDALDLSDMKDPGANGIVKRTAANTTTVAASSDIVGLFGGGTCSGYLKNDGTCSSPDSMVYPGAGIPISTGSAWTTSLTETDGYVVYGAGGAWDKSNAPAISAANMTSFPTLNQNTTGTASALAANGTNCAAGQAPLGIDASGNSEGCFTPAGTYVLPITDSTSTTSSTTAASATAVKAAKDAADSKQSPATTLAGYGITDAYTKTETDTAVATKESPLTFSTGLTRSTNTVTVNQTQTLSKIVAPSDSTTAMQITKADGTTAVFNVDTTNARVGVNVAAPTQTVDILGNMLLSNATVAGIAMKTTGATYGNTLLSGGNGNPSFIANWTLTGAQSDATKPSWAMVENVATDKIVFQRAPAGSNTLGTLLTLWASGCMSLGSTADCGAGNFTTLNYIVSGYEEKTASYTVSKDSSKITLASGTAVVTLPKTLPAGEVSTLVTVAGAAASGVSFAAESGGSLSWGDIGAPTFTNSKTSDVVCLSQNAAATTTATWRCTKGGDF